MRNDEKIFLSGDIVKVRNWEDMADEFFVDVNERILTPGACFIKTMEKYCGKKFVISGIQETGICRLYHVRGVDGEFVPYYFTSDHFETTPPIDFSILEKDFKKLI